MKMAGFAALAAVVWGAWMAIIVAHYPYDHVFRHDVDSPVLALEMSRDAGDISAVLHGTGGETMTTVNNLDLVFIPLYAFAIYSLSRVFSRKTRLLTFCVLVAALCDYLEDWRIHQAIGGANPAIYVPSLAKWGLLGIVFLLLAWILLKSDSPVYSLSTKRLMAMGSFAAGVLLLIDVALGQWIGYSHIQLANMLFAMLLAANAIGFLGHYLAIRGVQQTFVEDFCEKRKTDASGSLTSIKAERV